MFAGVAVALSELPAELVQQHGLGRRVHDRGGEPEVRFLLQSPFGPKLRNCFSSNRFH
jgi:hypothetical protein